MLKLSDGSTLYIRRNGAGYVVEHIAANGMLADTLECDDMTEAQAALAYGPSHW